MKKTLLRVLSIGTCLSAGCFPAFPGDWDGDGFSIAEGDCDDENAAIHPLADEICDGLDNDCNGDEDEGLAVMWYADQDGDGYGDSEAGESSCGGEIPGRVQNDSDCDDGDAAVNPAAPEICDEIDNNCDGDTDEGVTSRWYLDEDGDGYGDVVQMTEACQRPEGYTSDDQDCDDEDETVHPAVAEICDERDNDCDGELDEGCGALGTNIELAQSHARLLGAVPEERAGTSISAGGNVNDDDFLDILVGAPGGDEGPDLAGTVYLVLGPISGAVNLATAEAIFSGECAGDQAGIAVNIADDLGSDGMNDLLIGAGQRADRCGPEEALAWA